MMGPRVVWPKGKEKILADNYEGKAFGRPNDIVADKKGGLYFTDPPGNQAAGVPSAVYYIPPGGKAIRVTDQAGRPNGLQLSFDETILNVNDTGGIHVYAFDVQADGRLANRRIFATYAGRDHGEHARGAGVGGRWAHLDDQGRLYALTKRASKS